MTNGERDAIILFSFRLRIHGNIIGLTVMDVADSDSEWSEERTGLTTSFPSNCSAL